MEDRLRHPIVYLLYSSYWPYFAAWPLLRSRSFQTRIRRRQRTGDMGKKDGVHEMTGLWLARVNCACGWHWHNENLLNKEEDDLILEARKEFEYHLEAMRRQGK
jgi:hypothetical protein